jgi:nitroreductase
VVLCRETKYYLEDGSAATQNLLVAARAHGLGACWVAGDKKPYADHIREMVGAPKGTKLVSLVPLGVPAEEPVKNKRPLADVLHWEQW